MKARAFFLFAIAIVATACGGADKNARTPGREVASLAPKLVDAMKREATGDPDASVRDYLGVVEAAVSSSRSGAARSPDETINLYVLHAALDALVLRSIPALTEATGRSALAFRTRLGAEIDKKLAEAARRTDDPFARGAIARALAELAEHRGDARAAEEQRVALGCVREATVIGPIAWAPISGVGEADLLAAPDAPIPASTLMPGPFSAQVDVVAVKGRGCEIPLGATTRKVGVRDVVFDVSIERAQTIAVSLRARSTAQLRVGGKIVLDRPFELGSDDAARFALVDVTPGVVRFVARAGTVDGGPIEIDVWDQTGHALAARAPRSGDKASVRVSNSRELPSPPVARPESLVAAGAGALAIGDARIAERLLAAAAARRDAPPELLLLYARAVDTATDLSRVHRAERARAAYERVLEAWPTSWEAILAHALLEGSRRGQTEARLEEVRDLDTYRSKAGAYAQPLLDAFEATVLGQERMLDRARAALERAKPALDGTALYVDVEQAVVPRVGAERTAAACDARPPHDRGSLACHGALYLAGDHAGAERELERLRALRGGPDLFLPSSLRMALAAGDRAAAQRLYARMLPGERTLSDAAAVGQPAADLKRLALTASDAPHALPGLLRASGDAPFAELEGIAERVAAEDRAKPILSDAATAVLSHIERYDLDPRGLLHYVLLDVRRVSGTTDVEANAAAYAPTLYGHEVQRIFRRRIFKKDGRVLEPDRTPHASQSHAELSQLEQGDVVEAIYEGWGLPNDNGHVALDTPDLLPERTAVHEATLEIRLPKDLRGSMWSHPLLGKPAESTDGTARKLTWAVKDRPARRIEEGTPKMDRSVGVSFSTASWADVARALRETIASFDERDPEIRTWATQATAGAPSARAKVLALVEASGKAVKQASPLALIEDLEGGRADAVQVHTARTILADHEGTRTWLLARALREVELPSDIVLAENEPYSADPSFPPHFGRFMHPLLIVHLPAEGGAPAGDLWIDADVLGPPLPAGRISPELRGRSFLQTDGKIATLPASTQGTEGDEIDIRVALDEQGNARGQLTILLRGRAAQELAEAMVKLVGFERERALRGVALAWVPFANVDEVTLSSSEGSWQVALRAEISIGSYAQEEGAPGNRAWVLPGLDPVHMVFPRPYVSTLGATYAGQGARQTALAINRASQYHVRRRIELPAGTEILRAPGPLEVRNGPLEASRAMNVHGTVIEEDFRLAVATGTVPADKYNIFVADALRTDAAFLTGVRVKPTRTEPKKP